MLQSPKKDENRDETKWLERNILNNKMLWNFLIIRVFATNFDVGCFHASFERLFVKKIQHLFFFHVAYHPYYLRYFFCVFSQYKISPFNKRAGRYKHCFANNMDENKGWFEEILYICPYLSLYGRNRWTAFEKKSHRRIKSEVKIPPCYKRE